MNKYLQIQIFDLSLFSEIKDKMKTTKDILTENRESVISSIKWIFKIYRIEEVKNQMIKFLAFAEENINAEELSKSKKIKTDLKFFVQRMSIDQQNSANIKRYGVKNPKLADIMAFGAELHEEAGEVWNPMLKDWVKNKNAFSSMSK